jgi:hypothetical protein
LAHGIGVLDVPEPEDAIALLVTDAASEPTVAAMSVEVALEALGPVGAPPAPEVLAATEDPALPPIPAELDGAPAPALPSELDGAVPEMVPDTHPANTPPATAMTKDVR